jgi:hypothetical protein
VAVGSPCVWSQIKRTALIDALNLPANLRSRILTVYAALFVFGPCPDPAEEMGAENARCCGAGGGDHGPDANTEAKKPAANGDKKAGAVAVANGDTKKAGSNKLEIGTARPALRACHPPAADALRPTTLSVLPRVLRLVVRQSD